MIDHQRGRHEAVSLINACPWSERASSNAVISACQFFPFLRFIRQNATREFVGLI